jgi:uncharacterized protein YcfL
MKCFVVHTILVSLCLISCSSQAANAQSGDQTVLTVTTKNLDDQIDIQHKDDITTIDIHSLTGIGSAKFELASGSMPANIVMRLHLSGLEKFRITSRQAAVTVSGSSNGTFNITNQTITTAGSEYSITPTDPLWMKIEIVSDQTTKKIPLEEGFFEITVPKEFIQTAGNSFEIQWIDFYR